MKLELLCQNVLLLAIVLLEGVYDHGCASFESIRVLSVERRRLGNSFRNVSSGKHFEPRQIYMGIALGWIAVTPVLVEQSWRVQQAKGEGTC